MTLVRLLWDGLNRLVAAVALILLSPVILVVAGVDPDRRRQGHPVRPGPGRPRRRAVPDVEVPDDGPRLGRAQRAARHQRPVRPGRGRPADHPLRPVPAPHQPGRAAAAGERGARADEPGRPAAGRAAAGRHYSADDRRRLEVKPGHHRVGADQRPGRDRLAAAVRAGPLVRGPLVAGAGPADPLAHLRHPAPGRGAGPRRRAEHPAGAGREPCLNRRARSARSSTGTPPPC